MSGRSQKRVAAVCQAEDCDKPTTQTHKNIYKGKRPTCSPACQQRLKPYEGPQRKCNTCGVFFFWSRIAGNKTNDCDRCFRATPDGIENSKGFLKVDTFCHAEGCNNPTTTREKTKSGRRSRRRRDFCSDECKRVTKVYGPHTKCGACHLAGPSLRTGILCPSCKKARAEAHIEAQRPRCSQGGCHNICANGRRSSPWFGLCEVCRGKLFPQIIFTTATERAAGRKIRINTKCGTCHKPMTQDYTGHCNGLIPSCSTDCVNLRVHPNFNPGEARAISYKDRCARYGGYWTPGLSRKRIREALGTKCYLCGITTNYQDTRPGLSTKTKRPIALRGATYPTVDHIEPLSQGGDHTWWNVAIACIACNLSKGVDMDWTPKG